MIKDFAFFIICQKVVKKTFRLLYTFVVAWIWNEIWSGCLNMVLRGFRLFYHNSSNFLKNFFKFFNFFSKILHVWLTTVTYRQISSDFIIFQLCMASVDHLNEYPFMTHVRNIWKTFCSVQWDLWKHHQVVVNHMGDIKLNIS